MFLLTGSVYERLGKKELEVDWEVYLRPEASKYALASLFGDNVEPYSSCCLQSALGLGNSVEILKLIVMESLSYVAALQW